MPTVHSIPRSSTTGDKWFFFTDPTTGCTFAFTFCYRVACGGAYNDIAIGPEIFPLDDNCVASGFDPTQYKNIVEGAMGIAVAFMSRLMWGMDIPECPRISQVVWRLGKIECTSDWYTALRTFTIIMNGMPVEVTRIVRVTTACETNARCWNRYRYCWQVGGGIQVLMPHLISTGNSSWACPQNFVPPDAAPAGQVVRCHTGLCL